MIACIGWGSLIWCQKTLPIASDWHPDGPVLPVEFARESSGRRITLVICQGSPDVQTLWARLDVQTLDEAKTVLAAREGVKPNNIAISIGYWSTTGSSDHAETGVIGKWAAAQNLEGVVWTALKPKIGTEYRTPDADEVVSHLTGLEGHERDTAEEYVRLTPRQVFTPYRQAIENALGWTPSGLI